MQEKHAFSTDTNIDDQWSDLGRWCAEIAPIWSLPPGSEWRVDLSGCGYLGPFAAAMLFSTWLRGKQFGQKPTVVLPTRPEALVAFCRFSNLEYLIHGGRQADPNHASNETVPLYQFFDHAYEQSLRFLRLIRRHQTLTVDDEFRLTSAIHEVCQNIEDHAASPIGGVSCARYFSGTRTIRVAVVDRGVTIAGSLARRHALRDDGHALELVTATKGGTTSGTRVHNRGLGISNLLGFVRAMRGSLILLSGGAAAYTSLLQRELRFERLDWRFPGTAVFFILSVGRDDVDSDERD